MIARGCGDHRTTGGLYLMSDPSPFGNPIWDFLLDPPIPMDAPAQGVHLASPELTDWCKQWVGLRKGAVTWKVVLLLDHVGAEFYPTVPDDACEIREFGLSARIQKTFDFSVLKDAMVYIGRVHPKAIPVWSDTESLPLWNFWTCNWWQANFPGKNEAEALCQHYPNCLYHIWPQAIRDHEKDLTPEGEIKRPSFDYDPFGVVAREQHREEGKAEFVRSFPLAGYKSGLYGIFPITHIDAVKYVPDGCNVADADLPVNMVEK